MTPKFPSYFFVANVVESCQQTQIVNKHASL